MTYRDASVKRERDREGAKRRYSLNRLDPTWRAKHNAQRRAYYRRKFGLKRQRSTGHD